MNIFVAKLSYDTQESDLQNAFSEYGEIDSVKIIMDKFTGKSKGFGFIEMSNDEEGQNAINGLNDTEVDGRTIVVKIAEPRENRDNNGNLTPPPNAILTTEPPRLRVRTESNSSSNTWLFKSFKKTDITGNSILLEGDNNGVTEIKVYDGQYQRDRFGHFEPANQNQPATPLKGIGLLGSITTNPLVTSLLLPASSINYAGSTEEFITVFINNRDQVTLTAQNLDISAITMSPFRKWNFSNPTVVTESTAFGGETDWGFVRASSTEQQFMTTDFSLDACVGLFAGRRSRIGDIIIIVLRANPNSTGREVVDLVNIYTEANNLAFVGTTSRVKNWMGFLGATLGLIQEDNSDPDWYETKWISLI